MTADALADTYEVLGAATLTEGLTLARARAPEAIIVDLTLGNESGWELLRALQDDPGLRGIPTVLLSASASVEPPPGVRPSTAALRKPCRMADVRAVLAQLVGVAPGRPVPDPVDEVSR
jgi:CheY-like chemotaxis protein